MGTPMTTISTDRFHELLALAGTFQLQALIAAEREQGRAFGVVAEAARLELARRGEK